MNLQTATNAAFQTGIAEPMPGISALPLLPERLDAGKGKSRSKNNVRGTLPDNVADLQPDTEMVEDAGLGAMTGLGVAMMFNAGLALAGLVGWEIWTMLH